ncbi:MAG: hypothetical protein HY863_11355 [Chloroflexi bacterium]|nr:hypothetical protein [Chloroflexota bacterium]
MSKSIARVVFAVLISLGIIAAASPNVQARLGGMLRSNANGSISAEDEASGEAVVGGRARYFNSYDFAPGSHDCKSDPTVDY